MPIPILMPALSPTMEEGTLAKWIKHEGDAVAPGDVIAEIETDKATMEVEAVDEGTLAKILVQEGTDAVAVNAPIAVLLEEGEDDAALESFDAGAGAAKPKEKAGKAEEKPAGKPAEQGAGAPESTPAPGPQPSPSHGEGAQRAEDRTSSRIFASPLAKRLASNNNIDLRSISGSGPHGRVVKRDIEQAITAGGIAAPGVGARLAAPATPQAPSIDPRAFYEDGSYDEVPADNMRKTIARRLVQSVREVPHFPLTVDCELDALLALRKELNAKSPEGEDAYKLSVNDFVIKASALALKAVPDANASWAGDAILRHRHADIGVAVAIDGGLITPIVWRAETKGLLTISAKVKDLAGRARERKLQPHEYQGGTFSVSNLGMYGISHFTSIINQPQGAILSVGAGEQRPVVRDGALAIATVMSVTITCDHRAVDGAVGARFLQAFKGFVEDPVRMLL